MAERTQSGKQTETVITVDMNAASPDKAVTRREANIAEGVRDNAEGAGEAQPKSKAEREMMKRMRRLNKNLEVQFDQRQAAKDAEHQRQISDMQAKLDKLSLERSDVGDAGDAAHETAMKALQEKLEAAYEKGDSKASADITRQMSQLDAKFWAKKAQAAGQTTRAAAGGADQSQQQQQQRQVTGPTRAGARFISANEDWWEDPEFKIEQGAANTIFLELTKQEGFDPKSEETFKEVAKRMKKKFPNLDVRAGAKGGDGPGDDDDDDDDDDVRGGEGNGNRSQRRAATQNMADRGEGGQRARQDARSRTLTKQEIETMKACRLDPDNDRDVVQFLKEAVSLEQSA